MGKLYQTQARGAKAEQAFSIARLLIEELAANISDEHVGGHFLSQAASAFAIAGQAFGELMTRESEVATLSIPMLGINASTARRLLRFAIT